jgi:hypothetical protein
MTLRNGLSYCGNWAGPAHVHWAGPSLGRRQLAASSPCEINPCRNLQNRSALAWKCRFPSLYIEPNGAKTALIG